MHLEIVVNTSQVSEEEVYEFTGENILNEDGNGMK